ncbi:MAG: hypothetical protein CM1200mP14_28480 [Gammaproteobacteria bacterium]|nr:MAG: hypothetical protein CM1200mP14_28480 [Gammaproteobacteria bacterium]
MYGVLLEWLGMQIQFPIEGYSAQHALPVVQKVWRTAARLGYSKSFLICWNRLSEITYRSMRRVFKPSISSTSPMGVSDNIYWHTPEDIPSNVSAQHWKSSGKS